MSAGIYNIEADQSATFSRIITWQDSNGSPVNLTNGSARMQLRQGPALALQLDTDNGRIVLGGSAGTIALSINATDMGTLSGFYQYDLFITLPSGVTRLLAGYFNSQVKVTQSS